jgi:ComF family protein
MWMMSKGAVSQVTRLSRSLIELVYPARCLACRTWRNLGSSSLCAECTEVIERERGGATCPTCAASVAPYEVSLGRCGQCRGRSLRIAGTVRVGIYRTLLGQLLRAYKYEGREELQTLLGGWLAEAIHNAPWQDRIEAVVSVPTHWKRRFNRPFHAADALAAHVAVRIGRPNVSVLRRIRAGPHQIGLSPTERTANVRGAFALRKGVTLRDARVLLVDDVKTTGATLEECAKVLRRGGAAEVYAAVVLRVGWAYHTSKVLSQI